MPSSTPIITQTVPNGHWIAFRLVAYCGAILRFVLKWEEAPHAVLGMATAFAGILTVAPDLYFSRQGLEAVRRVNWRSALVNADVVMISAIYICTGDPESDIFLFYYLPVVMAAECLPRRRIVAVGVFAGVLMGLSISYLVVGGLPQLRVPLAEGFLRILAPRQVFLLLVVWVALAFTRIRNAQKERERNLADVIREIPSASVLDRELDALLDGLINLGFHRAYIGLVDDFMNSVYVARARNIAPRQVAMSRFSLDETDIMCDVVQRAKVGKCEPLVFKAGDFDPRFNKEIYDTFDHKDLARAFLPLVGEVGGKVTVVGTVECGCFGHDASETVNAKLKDAQLLASAHAQLLGENRTHVLLTSIAERAARIVDADSASIHMYEGETLCYQAGAGLATREFLVKFRPRDCSLGFGWEATQSKRPVIATSTDLRRRHRALFDRGVKSLVALPLLNLGSDSRRGVLYLHSWKPRRFTAADIEIEGLFARQLGAVIQNYLSLAYTADAADRACQVSVLQNSIQSLATGEPVDITKEIAKHTLSYFPEADCVILYEYFDGERRFSAPPVMVGQFLRRSEMDYEVGERNAAALWTLIAQHQPRFLANVQAVPELRDAHRTDDRKRFIDREAISSSAQLPLRNQDGTPVGLLFINYRLPHEFDEREKKAIGSFALAAAIAIQNRRQKERIGKLRKRTSELNVSLHVEEVANRILDQVKTQTPYTSAAVQVVRGDTRVIVRSHGFDRTKADPKSLRPISSDPWIADVLSKTRPTIVNDTSAIETWGLESVRSWIGLPLLHNNEPIGLVTIDHTCTNAFDHVDAEQLEQYGIAVAATFFKATEFTEAQRHIRDLELIRRIQEKTYTSPLGRDLPNAVVSEVGQSMGSDQCSMYLKAREGDRILLHPAALQGRFSTHIRDRGSTDVALGDNGSALLRAFRGTTVIDLGWDTLTMAGPRAGTKEKRSKGRSVIASPIGEAGHNIGVIAVEKNSEGFFSASDAKALEQVALAAGTAFMRDLGLELIQIVSQLLLEAKSVDDVLPRILSQVVKMMDVDDAAMYLLDGPTARDVTKSVFSRGMMELEPREGGLTEHIIRSGDAYPVEDTSKDPLIGEEVRRKYTSLVGVRLGIDNRARGVLYVFSKSRRQFVDSELSVLKSLAGQAALGIQKSRLLEHTLGRKNALHKLLALDRLAGHLFHDVKSPLSSFAAQMEAVQGFLNEAWEALEFIKNYQDVPPEVVGRVRDALARRRAVDAGLQSLCAGAAEVTKRTNRIGELMDEIPKASALVRLPVSQLVERSYQKAVVGKSCDGAHFELSYGDCQAQVETDAAIVVAALSNIIWNAVESLDGTGGTVALEAVDEADYVRIQVRDNGCGISTEDIKKVFSFGFSKGKQRDSGYGLWFAQLVFQATGITCDIDSTPGQGTTFILFLPREPSAEEMPCSATDQSC